MKLFISNPGGGGGGLPLSGGTLTGLLNFSGTGHAGLQLNNLTTTQRDALASPAAGMTVWNTTTNRLNVHDGSAWTAGFVRLAGDTMTGALTIAPSSAATCLTLTGGTVTTSNPLISATQTWNAVGTTFTGISLNVTDTASASASLLMNLQVGGVTQMSVSKAAKVTLPTTGTFYFGTAGLARTASGDVICTLNNAGNNYLPFVCTDLRLNNQTYLTDDAANTLAQRNSTNAQTSRLYGTYTDASNYRRLAISSTTGGTFAIAPEGAGTGASGNVLHISGLPTSNPGPGILWNNAGTPAIGT